MTQPVPLFPGGVVIIGTGLIGTSIGLALRGHGVRVWLTDGDHAAAALAADLGAGDLLGTGAGPASAGPASAGPASAGPASAGPGPASPGSGPASAGPGPVPGGPGAIAPPPGGAASLAMLAVPPGGAASLAVLAVPPDAVAHVLAAAQQAGLARCYTDVASVKARPLAQARALGCDLASYVPGHPLAGRERSGPAAARADLFLGRPWALCPVPETASGAVTAVTSLVRACGAEPVTAEAAEHDRWVALVSHAPHVVSSAMAARLAGAPDGALALAGQGLRDVTRIAAGDAGLWTQILTSNAAGVSEILALVAEDLRAAAEALAEPASSSSGSAVLAEPASSPGSAVLAAPAAARLTRLLEDGRSGVARIPGKRGAPAASYTVVQVVIPDQPGELARLFQAAGEAGINIEDIGIEHSPGLPAGVAELSVKPEAAADLAAALADRGWPAYTPQPGGRQPVQSGGRQPVQPGGSEPGRR